MSSSFIRNVVIGFGIDPSIFNSKFDPVKFSFPLVLIINSALLCPFYPVKKHKVGGHKTIDVILTRRTYTPYKNINTNQI